MDAAKQLSKLQLPGKVFTATSLVSVIIPTYNRAHFLRDALDSVFAQTYENWELIIVDDGSTDDTAEVVAAYGERVRYFVQENRGASAARNLGIAKARGELVAFLDSDDIWLPEKLALQVRLLIENPRVGLAGGGCHYVDVEKRPISRAVQGPNVVSQTDLAVEVMLPGSGSNCIVRRAVFDEVGVFDTSLTRGEDREMWMRISRRYEVRGVPQQTVLIRVHSEARPGVNFDVVRDCRMRINATIVDPGTRRRADAWMYFMFFMLKQDAGLHRAAIGYLMRSFWTYPGLTSKYTPRLKPTLERLLPELILASLRATYRRVRRLAATAEHSEASASIAR